MIRIGIIGCGHWGSNYVRLLSAFPDVELAACADSGKERLRAIAATHPNVKTTQEARSIIADQTIDALVIATPTSTHYDFARQALEAGKDVLCEKPLAATAEQCDRLADLADARGRILMVGHIFLFNPGIQKLREFAETREYGKIYYMHSTRTNLGPFRTDCNVIWDLAPHDTSIFNYLLDSQPTEVAARGMAFLQPNVADVTFISLTYPNDVLAQIHVSWLDPRKVRQITIVGDKKMVSWDDLDHVGPIKVYDKRVTREPFYESFGEFVLLAREGDITIPKVPTPEPLKVEVTHFLECVRTHTLPLTDGRNGADVVRVLEAAQKSLNANGAPVEVSP